MFDMFTLDVSIVYNYLLLYCVQYLYLQYKNSVLSPLT